MKPNFSRFSAAFLLISATLLGTFVPADGQVRRRGMERPVDRSGANVTASAVSDGLGAFISWQSRSEEGIVGYELFRYGREGREKVTDSFFFGGGLQEGQEASEGRKFDFFDASGSVSSFYQIESVHADGYRSVAASAVAAQVDDIAPVAGYSSEELARAHRSSESEIETSQPRYPKFLAAEMSYAATAPDPTTQKWVAAQAGVKITVKQDGIYRVSRTDLETAGFNVATPIKFWRLFADGNEVAIRQAPDGSFIEFYGVGRDTRETDARVYYLIGGTTKGLRMPVAFSRLTAGPSVGSTFSTNYVKKFRTSYTSTLLNGDAENFFGPLVSTTPTDVTVALNAIDLAQSSVSLTVRLQGIVNLAHSVNVFVNGVQVGTLTGSNKQSFVTTFSVPGSRFVQGNNTIRLTGTVANSFSVVDTISASYSKAYSAESNALSYLSGANKQVTVGGFSSGTVSVYDITDPEVPRLYSPRITQPQAGVFSANVITTKARALFAVADSAKLSPVSISANTTSTLSDTANQGQFLVVTHKNFTTEANAWAAYRQGLGFNVKVVDVEDVFDEFSFGVATTDGLNEFFKFAKLNWAVKPDYVLLIGDATYDFRGYLTAPFANYIPTRLFDTLYEETGSDDALVDFNNDGLAEIAIGRIPARTGAVVTQIFTKMQTFEQTVSTALSSRGVAFAHDQPDGYDFAGLNSRLAAKLPAGTPTVLVSRLETDARTKLLTALNGGRMMVNYSGHGSTGLWAASSFFSYTDASALTNGNNLTVFMMLTCLNGYFIIPSADSLAESALKAPNGGAPAAWASTAKTTPDVQDIMANRFFTKLSDGSIIRIGDLIRDAKTSLFAGRDVRLSWALLGDPAMKMR